MFSIKSLKLLKIVDQIIYIMIKNPSTNSKLLKKSDSCSTVPQSRKTSPEHFLKIKSFMKQFLKIFSSEVQSAKTSPKHCMHPTIKAKVKPLKSIFLIKQTLNELKTPEPKSQSTMSSFQNNLSTDLSKSPTKKSFNKLSASKDTIKLKTSEKCTKKYLIKQSKVAVRKSPTEIFDDPMNNYYAGISIPIQKIPENTNFCTLEYVLNGNKNSVNCVDSLAGKI